MSKPIGPDYSKHIPGPSALSEGCLLALEYAAARVDRECGTINGCTALYWHLRGIAESHVRRPTDGDTNG